MQFQQTSRGTCHDCFLDYTHDYVLLQSLARAVQRQLLQFHDARDEVQPLRNERIAVVRRLMAHVQPDAVATLLGLRQVRRHVLWYEQHCAELDPLFRVENAARTCDSQSLLTRLCRMMRIPQNSHPPGSAYKE